MRTARTTNWGRLWGPKPTRSDNVRAAKVEVILDIPPSLREVRESARLRQAQPSKQERRPDGPQN